ncbi:TB2/DP1, HVA22 family protein [Operophtera brumata]|uniref:TB2/DP1, HVA22 family protein n=1 Tax=Operophtera brumata TaxID=104452 RepID=A0A0L7LHW3_OPEBR|nr:TB2/DP1, HVA22 family protein [Operophtera brumata]
MHGGGGLVQQIRKSYSLSDLTECDPREERGSDEADDWIRYTAQRLRIRDAISRLLPRGRCERATAAEER